MTAAPDVYSGPAFTGWRAWRVMPYEQHRGGSSLRLCASGRYGLPKLWEPAVAARAACGKFSTTHEAPWLGCECGLHGYRLRDDAWDHLANFVDSANGEGALGWAFGRVSLWGRIVEHEAGYRAEFAYPYELTVYGSHDLANRVRGLYLVDVESASPDLLPKPDRDDDLEEEQTGSVAERLSSVAKEIRELSSVIQPPRKVQEWQIETWLRDPAFVEKELETSLGEREPKTITTKTFVEDVYRRAGLETGRVEFSQAGWTLYWMALRHDVTRFRDSDGRNLWSLWWCKTEGLVVDDPALEHLDRDVPFVQALLSLGDGPQKTKDIARVLGAKPQTQSQTIARVLERRWVTRTDTRAYELTNLGRRTAERGEEPPAFSPDEVFETLKRATAAAGGPVTSRELSRQYRGRASWLVPRLGQYLRRQAEAGRVTREKRPGSTRVYWAVKP